MKKNHIIFYFTVLILISLSFTQAFSQPVLTEKEQKMLDAIERLDTSIVKYFPRWKVCEPSIQIHVFESFRQAGYSADVLNKSNIEVLAAPGDFDPEYGNYQILLVSCGDVAMSPYQISTYFTSNMRKTLSGEYSYTPTGTGRTYCYKDIPPEVPVSAYQAEAIINYYQPTDVTHAMSLSLFEQDLKIGESGFWLRSVFGNDDAGYQFWSSGQASIQLQRPLYINRDPKTSRAIPYLFDIQLGGGYRIETGINPAGTVFSWLPQRHLNASQSGDFVVGLNFHMPFAPQFGVSFYGRVPFERPKTQSINRNEWGLTNVRSLIDNGERDDIINEINGDGVDEVIPIMHSSGKFSVFYNWWMDKKKPENFLRVDLGISYVETREMALLVDSTTNPWVDHIATEENITGLKTYKPSEAMDWLFLKLEYRNQDVWPFGVSVQIANQTMLGKAWIPLLGNWLLLEMKYSHVLRDIRPFELQNFFMISPVIRITI